MSRNRALYEFGAKQWGSRVYHFSPACNLTRQREMGVLRAEGKMPHPEVRAEPTFIVTNGDNLPGTPLV